MPGPTYQWQAVQPSALCQGNGALGKSVRALERVLPQEESNLQSEAAAQPSLVKDRIALLVQSDHSGEMEFSSLFRKELYNLCDSMVRPFCKKTHRPYPIRSQKEKPTHSVSSQLFDLGTLCQKRGREDGESLVGAVESVLQAEPDMLIICSDNAEGLEDAYAGHSLARQRRVLPHVQFSSQMGFSHRRDPQTEGPVQRMLHAFGDSLLEGKALLQMGIQREMNLQLDYDRAHAAGVWVVEYLPLLTAWRNAMNGREIPPREHVYDHLDRLSPRGWDKLRDGLHLTLDLNVFTSELSYGVGGARPSGCTLQEIGPVLTYLGRAGLCRVVLIQGQVSHCDSHKMQGAAELMATLVYKLVLLREEYS